MKWHPHNHNWVVGLSLGQGSKLAIYRLGLAERIRIGRGESSEDASQAAKDREEENPEEELSEATVLVIGTSGSGKTSTINSLLGREALPVNPFEGTKKVCPNPTSIVLLPTLPPIRNEASEADI